MMSWPASPRIRMRPIGPGSPMRKLGAPRSTLAGGASERSGRWPSRVWMTSKPIARAAASTAPIGFTARANWLTSLPSVSPKPPGSMKSRCMSMMSSAVARQSSAIGSGSAAMVPFDFGMDATRPGEMPFRLRQASAMPLCTIRRHPAGAPNLFSFQPLRLAAPPCARLLRTAIAQSLSGTGSALASAAVSALRNAAAGIDIDGACFSLAARYRPAG